MIHGELLDLPTTIRGFVRETIEGYTIVLNSRMSSETQRNTYQHELRHIMRGDLDSLDDIDRIEKEMHNVDPKEAKWQIPVF